MQLIYSAEKKVQFMIYSTGSAIDIQYSTVQYSTGSQEGSGKGTYRAPLTGQ